MNSATTEKATEVPNVDPGPASAEQLGESVDPVALDLAATLIKHWGYAGSIDAMAAAAQLLVGFSEASNDHDAALLHSDALMILEEVANDMPDVDDDEEGDDE